MWTEEIFKQNIRRTVNKSALHGLFTDKNGAGTTIRLGSPRISDDDRPHYSFGSNTGEAINGANKNDHLYGMGGDDTLNGEAGADWLEGNAGNDKLYGDAGSDSLYGGTGNKWIYQSASEQAANDGEWRMAA